MALLGMFLFTLLVVVGWKVLLHAVKRPVALEADPRDQEILKALAEGTLTDEDLEEIGIDPAKFRETHKMVEEEETPVRTEPPRKGGVHLSRNSTLIAQNLVVGGDLTIIGHEAVTAQNVAVGGDITVRRTSIHVSSSKKGRKDVRAKVAERQGRARRQLGISQDRQLQAGSVLMMALQPLVSQFVEEALKDDKDHI